MAMAGRSFSEDLSNEIAGKAILWEPAVAGAALLGPAGIVLGLLTSVAIVAAGSGNSPAPTGGDQSPGVGK